MTLNYAGMGWPNGAANNEELYNLPSPLLLMLSPQSRYHYDAARKKGKRVVHRGLPRIGARPAELNYDPAAVSTECLNLWDEQPHHGKEDLMLWNELDLNYERGDDAYDWEDLDNRYRVLGKMCSSMYDHTRSKVPALVDLHYGAWTPDHSATVYVNYWGSGAMKYEVIDIHAYGTVEAVHSQYTMYRRLFPDKRIMLTEWWGWTYDDTKAILEYLKELERTDPLFDGAVYFIWKWYNPSDGIPDISIVDRPDLRALFMAQTDVVVKPPVDPPIKPPSSRDIVVQYAKAAANAHGIPERLMVALGFAESGLKADAQRFGVSTKEFEQAEEAGDREWMQAVINKSGNDISFGAFQQTWAWSKEFNGNPKDLDAILAMREKYANIEYAANVAADRIEPYYLVYHDVLESLCRYNKPSIAGSENPNRGNYVRGMKEAATILGLDVPTDPPVIPPTTIITVFNNPSNVAGLFNEPPKGVVLHGSRSGIAGRATKDEFDSVRNYAMTNPAGLGWNVSVGDDAIAVHMQATEWGWHARAASNDYLSCEFAQATADISISDAQVRAFVYWLKNYVYKSWPNFNPYFPTHAEVEASGETGVADGKSDVFPSGDVRADELRDRILREMIVQYVTSGGEEEDPEMIEELQAQLAQAKEDLRIYRFHLGVEVAQALEDDVGKVLAKAQQEVNNILVELRRNA